MTTPDASNTTDAPVAIIGAGWAGLACALKLARAGYQPVVYESAPEAGGRARRARLEHAWRDSGQHLMLAGCRSLEQLLQEIGVRLPIVPFAYTDGTHAFSLVGQNGRSGMVNALLGMRGYSWAERSRMVAALAMMQLQRWSAPEAQTVADWLRQQKQPSVLIDYFWEPLALAILNTPIEQAAMARLMAVLRDTLGASCEALAILQPTINLSESVVVPLVRAIEDAGGRVLCGRRITAVRPSDDGRYAVALRHTADTPSFKRIVLTLPPWALSNVDLPFSTTALATRFGAQPIATVYLGFDADQQLPAPLVQLAGPTDVDARIWAMDRAHCGEPGVITISLSANGPWTQLDHETLVARCLRNLHAVTGLPATCHWQRVVSVKCATPGATPAAHLQPHERRPLPGMWLAGDWTHPHYPATLEAAVQSGVTAAEEIIRHRA